MLSILSKSKENWRNTLSWLLNEPEWVERVIPVLDIFVIFLSKIIYLFFTIFLRLVLGKKRSNKLIAKLNIRFIYICPSFLLFKLLYKGIRFLRLGDNNTLNLLVIKVPKHNYRYYCRINKSDFIPEHEEIIIKQFHVKQGDVVLDVGAHIGKYTIISSKRVGPAGKVIAIEADPENFDMLNRNIKLNQLNNVIALNYAAYSQAAKIKLYVADEQSGSPLYNTITTKRAKPNQKFIEINANTLDNLLQLAGIGREGGAGAEEVNWIKIDVEGAEFDVLKGATNILSKSKDIALLIEVHNLSDGTNLYRPIIEFLSRYNFKIVFEKTYASGEMHIILRKDRS
jgi:FkbM family methyltransferase